jgi:hypothetical protein
MQKIHYNNICKEFLQKVYGLRYKQGCNLGENKLYQKGLNEWPIWCFCWCCLKPLYIKPNSEEHKKLIVEIDHKLRHVQWPKD